MKWDRLFLVVLGNIFIAMGVIALFDWHSLDSALFGFSVGAVTHIHYWKGGRFLLKLK